MAKICPCCNNSRRIMREFPEAAFQQVVSNHCYFCQGKREYFTDEEWEQAYPNPKKALRTFSGDPKPDTAPSQENQGTGCQPALASTNVEESMRKIAEGTTPTGYVKCRVCHATGLLNLKTCPVCEGKKRVASAKKVYLTDGTAVPHNMFYAELVEKVSDMQGKKAQAFYRKAEQVAESGTGSLPTQGRQADNEQRRRDVFAEAKAGMLELIQEARDKKLCLHNRKGVGWFTPTELEKEMGDGVSIPKEWELAVLPPDRFTKGGKTYRMLYGEEAPMAEVSEDYECLRRGPAPERFYCPVCEHDYQLEPVNINNHSISMTCGCGVTISKPIPDNKRVEDYAQGLIATAETVKELWRRMGRVS